MAAEILPERWGLPHVLLAALVMSMTLAGIVAASTTTTAFGAYNTAWDGTADLRGVADDTGADTLTALNTSVYGSVTPNDTVAVVLSPDQRYGPREAARLRRFVENGGTLVVAEDFGPNGNRLLASVGAEVRFDDRPLRDERRNYRSPALPVAPNVTASPATEGVEQVTLNHGTVVSVGDANATVLVRSSEFSYLDVDFDGELDENETLARRPVVVRERVGDGTVYAVSDPSMFINAMLDRPDNERFVRNVFSRADTVVVDISHQSGQPPLAVALVWLRRTPLLQALLGVVGVVAVGYWPAIRRRSADLAARVGRSRPDVDVAHDPESLAAYLERRHPDWDEERVQRVMAGIKPRRDEGDDDD